MDPEERRVEQSNNRTAKRAKAAKKIKNQI